MRVSCSRELNGKRGINNFLKRLFCYMEDNYDIKYVSKKDKSDIHLAVVDGANKKGSKNVLRLDGAYYDTQRINRNQTIAKSIKIADAVVFQSEWAKTLCINMTKSKPKQFIIAHNGINQSVYKNKIINKHGFDVVFGACSHWRTSKRPKAIQQSFIKFRKQSKKNIGMFFIGKTDIKIKDPNIKFFGHVEGDELLSLYKSMDYYVHICHTDACPNTVIEALSAGCPVLCNNIGGTPELVKKDGVIVNIDKEFDFKPIKSMDVVGSQYVNTDLIAQGMSDIMETSWQVSRPDLDISVASKKYYDLFKSLLS